MDRGAFFEIFGSYFREKLQKTVDFLKNNTEVFSNVGPEDTRNVINKVGNYLLTCRTPIPLHCFIINPPLHCHFSIQKMLVTSYKAGREWEPYSDAQLYFIEKGERAYTCSNLKGSML